MGQWATYLRRKRTEHISIERLADELRAARSVVVLACVDICVVLCAYLIGCVVVPVFSCVCLCLSS